MDLGAELTLQIARLVQERPNPPRLAARWLLLPTGDQLTWADARAMLAALPKPILVAPLSEPGGLGIWMPHSLDVPTRQRFAKQIDNQVEYYTDKLRTFGMSDRDLITFEPATPRLQLSVPDYLRWAREYGIGVGVTLGRVPDIAACRILIMPPGGGGPPLGMQPVPFAPVS